MQLLTYLLFFMTIRKIKYLVWLHNSLVLRMRYASQICQHISSLWNTRHSSEDLHDSTQILHASVIAKSGFSKRSAVEPYSREPLIHMIKHVCYIPRIAICTSIGRTFNSETMNGDNPATSANSSVRSFSGLTGEDAVDFRSLATGFALVTQGC